MKQRFSLYSNEDHDVWKLLFNRQITNLSDKVCSEYITAINQLSPVLNSKKIPNFNELDEWFSTTTGWKIEVVPGLIPVDQFMRLLAEKKFCSSTWIRSKQQIDYLEEPDMFHDIFGHIPLLSLSVFSDFMQAFGELGTHFDNDPMRMLQLQKLYWFTIEFGLVNKEKPAIFGAGIISSFQETNRSLQAEVLKKKFNLNEVIETEFRTDIVQDHYVCIDSFDELFHSFNSFKKQVACHIG
jgi:phenylalanine-4-hydroxylase